MKKQNEKKDTRGRKPVKDKKVSLTLYPRTSQVKALGGVEKAKKKLMSVFPKVKNDAE